MGDARREAEMLRAATGGESSPPIGVSRVDGPVVLDSPWHAESCGYRVTRVSQWHSKVASRKAREETSFVLKLLFEFATSLCEMKKQTEVDEENEEE